MSFQQLICTISLKFFAVAEILFTPVILHPPGCISIPTFADSTTSFVYNYKPANFTEDFISALTALVTAQDDPQRLYELTEGTKRILNDYQKDLPDVLKQVKGNIFTKPKTLITGIIMQNDY